MPFYPTAILERPWRIASQAVTVPLGSAATVTITWPTPMPDADYTPLASVEHDATGGGLIVRRILTRSPAGITVRVENTSALTPASGTVHAAAIPGGA